MPDGTEPGTVDQQLNAEVGMGKVVKTFNDFIPWGSDDPMQAGGGGGGGRFRIASVAELDALIAQWTVILHKIDASGRKLDAAAQAVEPPADDEMSRKEADATLASLSKAVEHNTAMRKYAEGYITKLTNARNAYENTEGHNTSAVQHSDGA